MEIDPYFKAVDDFVKFARETEKEYGMLGEVFYTLFAEWGLDKEKIYELIWHVQCEWDL